MKILIYLKNIILIFNIENNPNSFKYYLFTKAINIYNIDII